MLVDSRIAVVSVGAAVALLSISAHAAIGLTKTTTFQATTNILDQCNAVTATAMAFPTYQPDAASPATATSTIKVKCTKNSAVTISLDKGATTGGTTDTRMMQSAPGKTLNYKLFSDSAYTVNWDDTNNKVAATGAGLGTDLTFTVYGQIPASQLDSEPGNYSDTVTVTVGY